MPQRLTEHAAELAEHFAQSTDPADLAKAVEYGQLAARRAMSVYAYGEAVRLLEGALVVQEVLEPGEREKRCDLLLALGDALIPAGEPLRAGQTVAEEAFQLAEAQADGARAAAACLLAIRSLTVFGGPAMAATEGYQRWAERADRYAQPGTADRVWADLSLARLPRLTGQTEARAAVTLRALALAREIGDHEAFVRAAVMALNEVALPHEEWLGLLREITERPRVSMSAWTVTTLLSFTSLHHLAAGDRPRAEELWHEAQALVERSRDATLLWRPLRNEAVFLTLDGRLEEAVALGEQMAGQAEEQGTPTVGRSWAVSSTGYALVQLGRAGEMLQASSEHAQLAGLEGDWGPSTRVRMALVLASLGRRNEAKAELAEFLARPDIGARTPWVLLYLLEAALLLEDPEASRLLAERCAGWAGLSLSRVSLVCPARLLGGTAALLGDRDRARAYYRQALELAGKIRCRPEIALTRLQLAELLLEEAASYQGSAVSPPLTPAGEDRGGLIADKLTADSSMADRLKAEGLAHLDFAIAEFREMKMQPALERALKHKGLLTA